MQRQTGVRGIRGSHVRRMHCTLVLAAVCCLGSGLACSGNTQAEEAPEPAQRTVLKVENRAFLDVTVYAYRSAQRIRLGQAQGNTTTKLTIPPSIIFGGTPLRFQADPIGGNRQSVSQEVSVYAGDEVVLIIPP